MLGGPAAGVARSRLPQVVLEAHLPSFFFAAAAGAAAAEPPEAAGRAPQQPPALAGERGQVVHAAVATVLRATTPAQPAKPGAAARLVQASGAGQASLGPGRDHRARAPGDRASAKLAEKFPLLLPAPPGEHSWAPPGGSFLPGPIQGEQTPGA